MWTLRIIRGGEKAVSTSDSQYQTKHAMLGVVAGLGEVAYRRRVNNLYIVHVR